LSFLIQGKHVFPPLPRKAKALQPTTEKNDSTRVSVHLDGTLSEARNADIGVPLPGALEFLKECVDAGMTVTIVTPRSRAEVHQWLQRHSLKLDKDLHLEQCVHVANIQPATDILLAKEAIRFGGSYPTPYELEELKIR
jgi:phosphoglycolate phosphatase-like HAD superfamily hydrolase